MFSVLFWNLYGRKDENRERRNQNLLAGLARLTARHQLDMLVFAECGIPGAEVVQRLNTTGLGPFHSPPTKSRKVRFFTRLEPAAVAEVFSDPVEDRLSILRVNVGRPPGVLLAGAHFHDRMSIPTEAGRSSKARGMARTIANTEDLAGHQRTVLVGDLNMNPFESGVVEAESLHALMTRGLAATVPELSSRRDHRCFYNPMWGHFGDGTRGPAGTYYFPNLTDPANHFWNIYDQVLLRPGLMHALIHLEILGSDGSEPLVTKNGRPRRGALSDHLPILFQLDLSR